MAVPQLWLHGCFQDRSEGMPGLPASAVFLRSTQGQLLSKVSFLIIRQPLGCLFFPIAKQITAGKIHKRRRKDGRQKSG